MQAVVVRTTMTVPAEHGRSAMTLEAGRTYVMHDVEAAGGREVEAFEQVAPLPHRPAPAACGGPLAGRMIVPFIGGFGDAISLLPVLSTMQRRNPRLQIDVTSTPGPAEVFCLSSRVNRVAPYPMELDEWSGYDRYLSLEDVHETLQAPGRALPEVFARALGIELVRPMTFDLTLPRAADAVAEPSATPLVGIAVGEGQVLRSYPPSMLRELVSLLVSHGFGCVLLGHADPAWNIPVCPPVITDMRSKTPTVLELAVWLRALDVVVSHDSFIMHLAGALGRPTVALFAPTSSEHAAPYAGAVSASSDAECAPCHEAVTTCPIGHDRCVAWDSEAVSPAAVAGAVLDRLRRQGRPVRAAAL